jgi:hypothetical protein
MLGSIDSKSNCLLAEIRWRGGGVRAVEVWCGTELLEWQVGGALNIVCLQFALAQRRAETLRRGCPEHQKP